MRMRVIGELADLKESRCSICGDKDDLMIREIKDNKWYCEPCFDKLKAGKLPGILPTKE